MTSACGERAVQVRPADRQDEETHPEVAEAGGGEGGGEGDIAGELPEDTHGLCRHPAGHGAVQATGREVPVCGLAADPEHPAGCRHRAEPAVRGGVGSDHRATTGRGQCQGQERSTAVAEDQLLHGL